MAGTADKNSFMRYKYRFKGPQSSNRKKFYLKDQYSYPRKIMMVDL